MTVGVFFFGFKILNFGKTSKLCEHLIKTIYMGMYGTGVGMGTGMYGHNSTELGLMLTTPMKQD